MVVQQGNHALSCIRALFDILFNFLLKRFIFPSSLSSVAISTSLIRGAYDHQDRSNVLLLRERNLDLSQKDLVTLVEVKVLIGVESSTSTLSGQGDDIVVKHVKRETLSEVPLEVRLEEVVSALEEIPSMVELDSPQLGKVAVLIFGAESIVENGCHKDGDRADGTSGELVVLSCDEIQDHRVESGH